MYEPIFITGAARSGTSLVAGVVNICGAWGGVMRGPNKNNQKGMFENINIIQQLIKPLLKRVHADPMCQKPLPVTSQFTSLPDKFFKVWKKNVIEIIKRQGYEDGPWFIKEPKMTVTWYVWAEAFPEATWVLVRRNPEDIVTSCIKTSFMRAYRTRPGWLSWVAIHEKRFEEMFDAKLKIYQIWPQRAIEGDFTELHGLINNLGLNWNFDEVQKFVTPSLWHNKRKAFSEEVEENGDQDNS